MVTNGEERSDEVLVRCDFRDPDACFRLAFGERIALSEDGLDDCDGSDLLEEGRLFREERIFLKRQTVWNARDVLAKRESLLLPEEEESSMMSDYSQLVQHEAKANRDQL